MLLAYLDAQRNHVLGILDGLSDDDLRRAVLPSGWNCLALVLHLALDVERFWFRGVFAGEQIDADESSDAEDGWQVPAGMTTNEVFDLYRAEIEQANAIIRANSLDEPPRAWPEEVWPDWRKDRESNGCQCAHDNGRHRVA